MALHDISLLIALIDMMEFVLQVADLCKTNVLERQGSFPYIDLRRHIPAPQ